MLTPSTHRIGCPDDLPSVPTAAARRLPRPEVVRLPAPYPRTHPAGHRSGRRMSVGIPISRIWPTPAAGPLDDAALTALYARADTPRLRVNFVTSADGAVSLDGYSAGLSGAPDKRVFGLLRMLCDGAVGGRRHAAARGLPGDPAERAAAGLATRARPGRVPDAGGRLRVAAARPGAGRLRRRPGAPGGADPPRRPSRRRASPTPWTWCGRAGTPSTSPPAWPRCADGGWVSCSARAARICSARSPRPTSSTSSA